MTSRRLCYGGGERWLRRIAAGEEIGRGALRHMQPFMVSLYEGELQRAIEEGTVRLDERTGIHVMTLVGRYDTALGLVLEQELLVG